MRDVFWTILITWLVYKIYNGIKSSRTVVFQKHEHHYHQEEGKVKIETPQSTPRSTKKNDDGEYVDYEEIK